MSTRVSPRALVVAPRRAIALALLVVGALTSSCTDGFTCECFFADRAISLTVTDAVTERGLDDFFVEVLVNDEPRGEPAECSSAFRVDNTCSFGDEPGIYHIIVRAPGYETRETVARVAEERDSELCCNALLAAKQVAVALSPMP